MNTADKIAALTIRRVRLDEIKSHPKNPRKHPDEGSREWEILKESLGHDYFDPLVLNERNGMLVSGHFRWKVLTAEGFTAADVSIVDYDEPTHLARMIAANTLLGEYIEEVLADLAREIEQAGLSPALAGLDDKSLAAYLDGPVIENDDTEQAEQLVSEAETLAEKWKVEAGELFKIGPHRLLCGDCRVAPTLDTLMAGAMGDMVWTDPPYNVKYDSIQERRIELNVERGRNPQYKPQEILNDDLSEADYFDFLRATFANAFRVTKLGGIIYVAHADSFGLLTRQAVAEPGWKVAQCLVWVKNAFTLGRQDYQWQHEPILYGWKPGAAHYWQGGYDQSTIIDDEERVLGKASKEELVAIIQRLRNSRDSTVVREPRNASCALHPTIKPLSLVARQVWNSSRPGEIVVELFGGSGTTMAAAEQTGRVCYATELDPKFCAVILERMSAFGHEIERIAPDVASNA